MVTEYRIYKPRSGNSKVLERAPSIQYVPGKFAVHVGVREVGFMLTAVSKWSKDYQAAVPEGTIVIDTFRNAVTEASSGAYIFESQLASDALKHRFETSQGADRTTACRLLAQLSIAEAARQEYMSTLATHRDMDMLLPLDMGHDERVVPTRA